MTERDISKLAKYPLWQEEPEIFEAILLVLFEYDPLGICIDRNPKRQTEYASEANAILEQRKGDIRTVLFDVFERWFCRELALRITCFDEMTTAIEQVLRRESAC